MMMASLSQSCTNWLLCHALCVFAADPSTAAGAAESSPPAAAGAAAAPPPPPAAAAGTGTGAAAAAVSGSAGWGSARRGGRQGTVSNRRISFSQHINKSVKSSSHARRVTLADLTPGISTPEEHALWHYLYCMHTNGTRTQWIAFTAEWNGIADMHARGGSKAIMHKRIDQLQKFQQKQVRNILSQTDAPAGPFMQAGQPPQQQQQQ
jgi:hypothetical protein